MAKYRLKKEHYLQQKAPDGKNFAVEPRLHEKDAEIDWAGTPSLHMEPLDTEATERSEARMAAFDERKKEAAAKRGAGRVGWTPQFEQNYVKIITRPEPGDDAPAQAASGSARNKRRAA